MADQRLLIPGEEEANQRQNELWEREERFDDCLTWLLLIVGIGGPLVGRVVFELSK